jgi:hypothetical protein
MEKRTSIKVFENKSIRTLWDEEQEKWYVSVIDVIEVRWQRRYPFLLLSGRCSNRISSARFRIRLGLCYVGWRF